LTNKLPDEYKTQIITYFLVIEDLNNIDFIVYSPDCRYKDLRFFVRNFTREDLQNDIDKAKEKVLIYNKDMEKIKEVI